MSEEPLATLLARTRSGIDQDRIVTADEVAGWPTGLLAELLLAGRLVAIRPANSVICDACFEGHVELVQVVEEPPGSAPRHYIPCPVAGRVEVDPMRMRRWRLLAPGDDREEAMAADPTIQDGRIPGVFDYTDGYRWVKLYDDVFTLSERQALVVRMLHEAHLRGRPDIAWSAIAARLKPPPGSSMSQVFRNKPGWRRLILQPARSMYRLNLPS